MPLTITSPHGQPVDSLDNWPLPKKDYQWTEGRSAMESARRWLSAAPEGMPPEIRALLDSNDITRSLVVDRVIPEFVTPLPERGEGRNHDVLVRAHRGGTHVTIGIEAKTDEPFDELIGDRIKTAESKYSRTKVPRRAASLLEYVFGRECDPRREPFCGLRYQLITAAAGCAAQATRDRADYAVFVVHELITWKCKSERLATNRKDFAAFIAAVFGGSSADVEVGHLYGPVRVTSVTYARQPVRLFAGKAISPPIEAWEWQPNRVSPLLLP